MPPLVLIRWFGRTEFLRRLSLATALFMPEMGRNLKLAGEIVIGKSREQFQGSRTRARRKGRAVTSPDDKLGVDTGQYRKSITQDARRVGTRRWVTEVGPQVKYARVHELGIGRQPRRQVLTPGVKKSEAQVVRIIGRTFRVV
jgi:hypothetical protein